MREQDEKVKDNSSVDTTINAVQINDGKPVSFELDTAKPSSHHIVLNVHIPASQCPGRYSGNLELRVNGDTEIVAPTSIPYQIEVDPSTWEQIAPVAVPIMLIFRLLCSRGFCSLALQRPTQLTT